MIRELITKLNCTWVERFVPARRRYTAPLKIWFDADVATKQAKEVARNDWIVGETVDFSRTGVAFLVPSIRVNDKYLAGQGLTFNMEISLPNGKVHLRAVGCRYEQVGIHASLEKFLVGARIEELVGQDKETYENFLRNRNPGVAKATAHSLKLHAD